MKRKKPDLRTRAGKVWKKRSEAAKRGWITRRENEFRSGGGPGPTGEIIIEEPIETVGGPRTQSGRRRK